MTNEDLWEITDNLAAAPRADCYEYMEQQEYYNAVRQMIEDLARLARDDGCIAAAFALTALQKLSKVTA